MKKIVINLLVFFLVGCSTNESIKTSDQVGLDMDEYLFDGQNYHDDRMYILYVAKCVSVEAEDHYRTTIYHKEAPENHAWCIVTYRNSERYQAVKVDLFETEFKANEYLKEFAPRTPLVNLNGQPKKPYMTYSEYTEWTKDNGVNEYDYKSIYPNDVNNPQENIYEPKR